MNFVIYARKSMSTQKGKSIDNQIEMCKNYIRNNFDNGNNQKIFCDFGFSGKNTNRKGFLDALDYIEENNIDFFICYKLDRVSRNVSDFYALIELFNKKSINFISIKEKFDTSNPMGRAMLYIASIFSQLERETIAERVKDNMYMLAHNGIWLGGNAPSGYKKAYINNHYYLEHTSYLNIVQIIFDKMLLYKSISEVKKYLDNKNIKTIKGNKFCSISIRQILKNPVYCIYDENICNYYKEKGSNVYCEKVLFDKNLGVTAYNKNGYKNEKDFIISVGKHKGIIKSKDFININEFFKCRNMHKPHNKKALLSGRIICGNCGSKMMYKAHHNIEKNDIYYYICKNKLQNGKKSCNMKNIKGNKFDDEITIDLCKKDSIYKTRNFIDKKIKYITWYGNDYKIK